MSIITTMRKQAAVYWAMTGVDTYGRPTWTTPVQILCRWDDITEEFIDPHGERQLSRSIVYVDRDMQAGDVLKLGELDSGVVQDAPKDNDGAWEIRMFGKISNLRNSEYLRTATL